MLPQPVEPTVDAGAACWTMFEVPVNLDLLLLVDRSSAMQASPDAGVSWEQAVRTAVSDFVQHPASAGTAVGVQYFPLGGQAPQSCAADYATPAVELAPLPENAPALLQSLATGAAAGLSPTGPALRGAIEHLKLAALARGGGVTPEPGTVVPRYAAHVVLVTAGLPTECQPVDVSGLASIASAALGEQPQVRTFVIALGSGLESLHGLAAAGGSNSAHLITGGDVAAEVRNALFEVAGANPACTLEVPPPPSGEAFPVDRISVQYLEISSNEWIPKLNRAQDCELNGGHGWFFDHPVTPTKIELCAGTCAKVPGGEFRILLDCPSGLMP